MAVACDLSVLSSSLPFRLIPKLVVADEPSCLSLALVEVASCYDEVLHFKRLTIGDLMTVGVVLLILKIDNICCKLTLCNVRSK